jgi:hypothetical protein
MGGCPRAPFETVPVVGLVRFIAEIGKLLGATLDLYPKKACIKECAQIAKNRFSQLEEFWEAIYKGLATSFVYLNGFVAVQMIYKSSSAVYKGNKSLIVLRSEGDNDVCSSLLKSLEAFSFIKSNVKPIQYYDKRVVWMVCRPRDQSLQGPTTNGKKSDWGGGGRQGAYIEGESLYIVAVSQSSDFKEPDLDFLVLLQVYRYFNRIFSCRIYISLYSNVLPSLCTILSTSFQ